MPLPTSKSGLEAAGYMFDNDGICRGCGEPIEWWICPSGKRMPITVKAIHKTESVTSPIVDYQRVPHWAECEAADDFRKR
jgi:hypothetical protein